MTLHEIRPEGAFDPFSVPASGAYIVRQGGEDRPSLWLIYKDPDPEKTQAMYCGSVICGKEDFEKMLSLIDGVQQEDQTDSSGDSDGNGPHLTVT